MKLFALNFFFPWEYTSLIMRRNIYKYHFFFNLRILNNNIFLSFRRYNVAQTELDLKELVKDEKLNSGDKKKELKKQLSALFAEKYRTLPAASKTAGDKTSHLRFFFKRLRF